MLKRLLLIILVLAPLVIWMSVKYVRVLAPQFAGVSCEKNICTDDMTRYQEASALYDEGTSFVDSSVGMMKQNPRVIFCASETCSQSFGLGRRSAMTIGTFGIVISPRAWKPYYVRHEMIHHLQNERLGMITVLRDPQWFVEGMAYTLSGDPREKLHEPFEQYRLQFKSWYKNIDKNRLWEEAQKL